MSFVVVRFLLGSSGPINFGAEVLDLVLFRPVIEFKPGIHVSLSWVVILTPKKLFFGQVNNGTTQQP